MRPRLEGACIAQITLDRYMGILVESYSGFDQCTVAPGESGGRRSGPPVSVCSTYLLPTTREENQRDFVLTSVRLAQ